ncbi:MAG: hypothetical protein HQ582_12260, partial [Planctomycetes bacterium]|nr:hypothetical protein [Planctomycetota bacterium]
MFFVTCGLLAVLALATSIGVATISANRAASRIAGELARIRGAGEPASAIELAGHYRLPPGVEDTTDLWLDATRQLKSSAFRAHAGDLPIVGAGVSDIPPPNEPWDDLEAAEGLLRKYHASLGDMHAAADLGGAARYPVDFGLGSPILLVHAQRLRAGALLLALEAHVCAHRGDPHGAARAIRTIFMLARSLEREPIAVSLLVRLACDGIAREQLRIHLPTVDFSDDDLVGLQDGLRAIDYRDGLYQAMLGERAMGIDAFENPNSTSEEVRISTGAMWRFSQSGGIVFYLEHMDRAVWAARQPWPQALEAAERAEADLDDLVGSGSLPTAITHIFPEVLASNLDIFFESTARNVAMTGAADAAIGVELYRRAEGKLPQR